MKTVLLLGGTAETGDAAGMLLAAGFCVVITTATDQPLPLPDGENVIRLVGRRDVMQLTELIRQESVCAVVDVTHPYAVEITGNAQRAARETAIPYFRYERPAIADAVSVMPSGTVQTTSTHAEAARLAVSWNVPVLLATGANTVGLYAATAREAGVRCVARVLPGDASHQACQKAGLDDHDIIAARGPFSKEENERVLRTHGIGVLVTKDGGVAGGLREKLAAAASCGCRVVIVNRPVQHAESFSTLPSLVQSLISAVLS